MPPGRPTKPRGGVRPPQGGRWRRSRVGPRSTATGGAAGRSCARGAVTTGTARSSSGWTGSGARPCGERSGGRSRAGSVGRSRRRERGRISWQGGRPWDPSRSPTRASRGWATPQAGAARRTGSRSSTLRPSGRRAGPSGSGRSRRWRGRPGSGPGRGSRSSGSAGRARFPMTIRIRSSPATPGLPGSLSTRAFASRTRSGGVRGQPRDGAVPQPLPDREPLALPRGGPPPRTPSPRPGPNGPVQPGAKALCTGLARSPAIRGDARTQCLRLTIPERHRCPTPGVHLWAATEEAREAARRHGL